MAVPGSAENARQLEESFRERTMRTMRPYRLLVALALAIGVLVTAVSGLPQQAIPVLAAGAVVQVLALVMLFMFPNHGNSLTAFAAVASIGA